jgi:hypothetical protein
MKSEKIRSGLKYDCDEDEFLENKDCIPGLIVVVVVVDEDDEEE